MKFYILNILGFARQLYTLFCFTFLFVVNSVLIIFNLKYFFIVHILILSIWWSDFLIAKIKNLK